LPAEPVTLGSSSKHSQWAVPWDSQISKLHATLTWRADGLLVQRRLLPTPTVNKIFHRGQPADEFCIAVGEHFVIGRTTFRLVESEPSGIGDQRTPDSELTCSPEELRQTRYLDPDERLEALAALPGLVRYSTDETVLERQVLEVLLRGIRRADAAAVVCCQRVQSDEPTIQVRQCRFRHEQPGGLEPSRRLLLNALDRRQPVRHVWRPQETLTSRPTEHQGIEWAICAPLLDDGSAGWALYLTGARAEVAGQQEISKGDLKFAELVAEIFGSLRRVRELQRRQAVLDRFLSGPVLQAMAERNMDDVFRPRQCDVTVLFCDLRGSSRIAEEGVQDLSALWDRVSEALGIMGNSIAVRDGVIGDFQGDATMGFWGWPQDCPDQIERAARTALDIQKRFAQARERASHPLAGFTCAIGIAHGPAIAGRLGTLEQFKVDVFGPVVNLASRLESMTKRFQAGILVDEAIAERLTQAGVGWARCRRLARVKPFGMARALTVSELLPPSFEPGSLPEGVRRGYETALDAFLAGRWDDARDLLSRLPPGGAVQFLTSFMNRHPTPPAGWDGAIELESK
jgi:adenylate cyclase